MFCPRPSKKSGQRRQARDLNGERRGRTVRNKAEDGFRLLLGNPHHENLGFRLAPLRRNDGMTDAKIFAQANVFAQLLHVHLLNVLAGQIQNPNHRAFAGNH